MRKVMENTVYGWFNSTKDIVLAILSGLIPLLPGIVQNTLDFMGVTEWLNKSADKYSRFEEKKKKEREYMEYAKNLEKMRPESPNVKAAKTKIEFPTSSSKTTDKPAANKKVFDKATNQFKIVPDVATDKLKTSASENKLPTNP